MSIAISKLEKQIARVREELMRLGPMRPGSLSCQYKNRKEKKGPFYQLSYTHKMKSRSEYVRPENLKAIKCELANFKKFRRLIDRWIDLSLKLSQLKSKGTGPRR
jgi:hypothetical protein